MKLVLVVLASICWLLQAVVLDFDIRPLLYFAYIVVSFLTIARILKNGWGEKIFRCLAYFSGVSVFGFASTMIATAAAFPLKDGFLLAADGAFGFSWLPIVALIGDDPVLSSLLMSVYVLFDHGLLALMVTTIFMADRDQMGRVAWALFVALNLTAIGGLIAPCLSAPVFLGLPNGLGSISLAVPQKSAAVVEALRSGAVRDFKALTGVVTMPSFHTSGSIIFVWAVWPLCRHLLWRMSWAGLGLLITVSAIPVGGHYLVDILAGACVAFIAIACANRSDLVRFLQPLRNPPSRLTASWHVSSAPANERRI